MCAAAVLASARCASCRRESNSASAVFHWDLLNSRLTPLTLRTLMTCTNGRRLTTSPPLSFSSAPLRLEGCEGELGLALTVGAVGTGVVVSRC